ncbi:uncharacterized protein [Eurosta solidaginis]|uniref:uncharacterized protein n=1 Tax=Eurosta solidaginis TaxID=178769 RepID=UPI00353128FF
MATVDSMIEDQRNTYKHLQWFQKNFDEKPAASKTAGLIQGLLTEIELLFRTFKQGHDDICAEVRANSIADADVPYLKDETFYDCYDLFINFKAKLLDLQLELALPTTPGTNSTFTAPTSRNDTISAAARLPKIDIPTFLGDYLEWIPFRDMFLSLVYNNTNLTQVQKYFYLKVSCTGTPKKMVEEYPATNTSYEPAWAALVNRYHNKRKLVDQILRKLVNAENTDGRLRTIQQLLDITRNCLALLRALEVDTSNWDPILMFLLTQKIDKQTRKEWEQSLHGSTDIPQVKEFLKFLDSTYKALEFVEEGLPIAKLAKPSVNSHKDLRRGAYAKSVLTATTATANNSCSYCQQNHFLYKCFKFAALPAVDKKEFVKQNKLCMNCLGKGHTYSNCTTTSRCKVCGSMHHTLLHSDSSIGNSTYNSHQSGVSNTSKAATVQSTHVHTLSTNISTQVLLATVRVIVETPSRKFCFKALVDQGAQASFIYEDAAKLLRLNTRNVTANISGIGGSQFFTTRRAAHISLRSAYNKHFNLECQFLLLPRVTTSSYCNRSQLPEGFTKRIPCRSRIQFSI